MSFNLYNVVDQYHWYFVPPMPFSVDGLACIVDSIGKCHWIEWPLYYLVYDVNMFMCIYSHGMTLTRYAIYYNLHLSEMCL